MGNSGGPGNSGPNYQALLAITGVTLLMVIPIVTCFLVLYAVGTLLSYMNAEPNALTANLQETKPQETTTYDANDDRVEIIPLPKTR